MVPQARRSGFNTWWQPIFHFPAECAIEAFSTTCAVCMEDCGAKWLSGCRSSVVKHWQLMPGAEELVPSNSQLFIFLYHCLIISNELLFSTEVRCSEEYLT